MGRESSLKRQIARFQQPERRKGLPMSKVKYISSPNEIPAGQKHVLVDMARNTRKRDIPLALPLLLQINQISPFELRRDLTIELITEIVSAAHALEKIEK
jgi:hypothetical protein